MKLLAAYGILSPIFYLSYHGWASQNLIDTTETDKLAFRFWVVTLIFATVFTFRNQIVCGVE